MCNALQDAGVTRKDLPMIHSAISDVHQQPVQNVAVVMAVEMGLLDILVARPGESVPSKELAHQSAFDETLIGIVLHDMPRAPVRY